MTALLFEDKFAPITSEIGFLESNPFSCAEAFVSWQTPIHSRRGVSLITSCVGNQIPSLFTSLLPLTSIERRRYLFAPTRSKWTAYFDNGWAGGDPASTISYLAGQMKCRGVRAVCIPHTIKSDANSNRGRYGAVILEVYNGTDSKEHGADRSIYVSNDGGRWVFGANGKQLEFENVETYKARAVRDRFTPDLFSQYLKALGIDVFSDSFYLAPEKAFIVSKVGPAVEGSKEYSLEQARVSF